VAPHSWAATGTKYTHAKTVRAGGDGHRSGNPPTLAQYSLFPQQRPPDQPSGKRVATAPRPYPTARCPSEMKIRMGCVNNNRFNKDVNER
jgi:hypothetical protein